MKNTKKILLGIGILLLLGFILLGIGKFRQQTKSDDIIRIGILMPMTGENSTFAIPMLNGMKLAISRCDSKKYQFFFADSKNTPKTALACVQNFISVKKIKYIVGDFSSSTTLAIEPITTQNGVFLLSPGAQSPKLSNISPLFARNYPSTLEESFCVAKLISEIPSQHRIAVLYANDEYGKALAKVFCSKLIKTDQKVTYTESFGNEQVDFRGILAKLVSLKITLVYLVGNPKAMGTFMKQYGEYGISLHIISNIAFLEKACLDLAGDSACGVIVPVTSYDPASRESQSVQDFATLYEKQNNAVPTICEAVGFDAINILLYGIEHAKNKTPRDVGEIIRNLKNYHGATGILNFVDGDVSFPIKFKQVQKTGVHQVDIKDLRGILI